MQCYTKSTMVKAVNLKNSGLNPVET